MSFLRLATVSAALVFGVAAAHATWYTNESQFLSAISATRYIEDFNDFTFGTPLDGTQATWSAPGANGYGWTASATNGLWANNSSLSTNISNDPITFTFSGSPVTAFGGRIANTDLNGNVIAGTATIQLAGGDASNQSVSITSSEQFLGWVGSPSISSVTFSATSSATNNWVQVDHAITGAAAVPEPTTMFAMGAGALALLRRRRKA